MDAQSIRCHAVIQVGMRSPDVIHFGRRILGRPLRPGKVVVRGKLRLQKQPKGIGSQGQVASW